MTFCNRHSKPIGLALLPWGKQLGLFFVSCFFFVGPLVSTVQAQQASDFENLEDLGEKGFFKNYIIDKLKAEWGAVKSGTPLSLSGGIGVNMRSYNAWGVEDRQAPFFYTVNANATASYFKIQIPFSLVLSSQGTSQNYPTVDALYQPFVSLWEQYTGRVSGAQESYARFGMSPFYKSVKVHLGHRSMNFSPLTMANTNFFGVGTEITVKKKIRLVGLYGRFADAVPRDLSLTTPNPIVYERIGQGAKVGYGDEGNFVDLIWFTARDNANSVTLLANDTTEQNVSPEESLVWGINTQYQYNKITFKFEGASSAHSPNTFDPEGGNSPALYSGFLYNRRVTTNYKTAVDGSVSLELGRWVPSVQYKRIDPGYRSLGTFFFNDDLENINVGLASSLLDNKLQAQGALGVQNNNLDQTKEARTSRTIGSLNANLTLGKVNVGLNYSNFTSSIDYVLNEALDSLNAVVVTEDAGANVSYTTSIAKDTNAYQLAFNYSANLQMVNDDVEDPLSSAASEMLVINASHSLATPQQWRYTLRFNYNTNELANTVTQRYGAGGGVAKSFLDGQLVTGIDLNYFLNRAGDTQNNTLNGSLKINYVLKEKHNFSLATSLVNQTELAAVESAPSFSELITTVGYNYRFSVARKKKEDKKAD